MTRAFSSGSSLGFPPPPRPPALLVDDASALARCGGLVLSVARTRLLSPVPTSRSCRDNASGASLLSSLALSQLYRDATTGMRHQRAESWVRFATTATASIAGAVEAAGTALDNMKDVSPRYARHTRLFGLMKVGGKAVGVVAGVVLAIVDAIRSAQEFIDGNYAIGSVYLISAGAGFVLTCAIIAGSVFIGVVAFAALVLASVLMLWLEDTAGHEWLGRCLWGNLERNKYLDLEIEMKEYEIAMRAV